MTAEIFETAHPRPSIWRSAIATLGTRAIDLPSRYGFHILVAWKLGLVSAGAFYIVFSVITIVAGVGRFGIDRALTREVARTGATGSNAMMRSVISRGLLMIAIISTLSAIVVAALAPLIAIRFFHNPLLVLPLVYGAMAIVPLCVSAGVGGVLAGLHRVSLSQMIYSWLWPALFCLMSLPFALTLDSTLLLLLAATGFAALLSGGLLWRYMPAADANDAPAPAPTLLRLSWSLFTMDIVQTLVSALPALVLGIFASQAAVGAYALAWRLALILNLLVVAVAAMASPRFADHAARKDFTGLQHIAAQSLGLVLLMGIIPLFILFLGAPYFLALFGTGFDSGISTLRWLLIGQFILMLSATTPELLGMTGHERALQSLNSFSILLYLPALCLSSIKMGADGAAIATLLVSMFSAIGATWLARKYLGFSPLGAFVRLIRGRNA